MKRIIITLALLCHSAIASGAMPEFPVNKVTDYPALQMWIKQAPHTTAAFTMERTMPSGRILKSRGSFEYRLGQGMMWRTSHPVRNAMLITPAALTVYDAKGRELRRTDLQGVPSGRITGAFTQQMDPAFLKQMERIFDITCRADVQKHVLVLGLKARHESNDLRWMLLVIRKGELNNVYYESGRQGVTKVTFTNVRNGEKVPESPFEL
ncbi:MAG: hypothetical protein IKW48_00380 [Akkermansia sp.]|nr:hypothetical protein [Akkermansia sp.]